MKSTKSKIYKTRNKNLRKRYDKILIIVAVVGISGSIIVFNSYASRRIDTQKPGTYQFSRIIAQNNSKLYNITKTKSAGGNEIYGLNNTSEMKVPFNTPTNSFCIYGWNRTGSNLSVVAQNITNQPPITFNDTTNDYPLNNAESKLLKCYDTSQTSSVETDLIIESTGNVWLDKIVTE